MFSSQLHPPTSYLHHIHTFLKTLTLTSTALIRFLHPGFYTFTNFPGWLGGWIWEIKINANSALLYKDLGLTLKCITIQWDDYWLQQTWWHPNGGSWYWIFTSGKVVGVFTRQYPEHFRSFVVNTILMLYNK